jgi:hypothetical protein
MNVGANEEYKVSTEQVGSRSNVSDVYAGGARFEYRPKQQLSRPRFSVVSSVPPGERRNSTWSKTTTPSFYIPSNSSSTNPPMTIRGTFWNRPADSDVKHAIKI